MSYPINVKEKKINLFLGIDVQINRGCPYYIINAELDYVDSGWLLGSTPDEVCLQLDNRICRLMTEPNSKFAVGIDAPRMGLSEPRAFYWRGENWHSRTGAEKGYGRHCEVVIKALGIANPQWTQLKNASPPWMELGYRLFYTLRGFDHVYEVFPSASYTMLKGEQHQPLALSFTNFVHGPKDMLDACMCAYTVHAFLHGNGFEVGGGDGLGTIVLPGNLPVADTHPVLQWPTCP